MRRKGWVLAGTALLLIAVILLVYTYYLPNSRVLWSLDIDTLQYENTTSDGYLYFIDSNNLLSTYNSDGVLLSSTDLLPTLSNECDVRLSALKNTCLALQDSTNTALLIRDGSIIKELNLSGGDYRVYNNNKNLFYVFNDIHSNSNSTQDQILIVDGDGNILATHSIDNLCLPGFISHPSFADDGSFAFLGSKIDFSQVTTSNVPSTEYIFYMDRDCSEIFRHIGDYNNQYESPYVYNDRVIVVHMRGIDCIDKKSSVLWSKPGNYAGPNVAYSPDGIIYCVDVDKTIQALNTDGTLLWSSDTIRDFVIRVLVINQILYSIEVHRPISVMDKSVRSLSKRAGISVYKLSDRLAKYWLYARDNNGDVLWSVYLGAGTSYDLKELDQNTLLIMNSAEIRAIDISR